MKKSLIKTISGLSIAAVTMVPLLTTACSNSKKTEIHIMALNDIHGSIPGYGDDYFNQEKKYAGAIRMADAMQQVAEKSADYIILSGGDQNSSGKFSACTEGDTMYPVLREMGISYSAVGNHAWAWGGEKLTGTQATGWEGHYANLGKVVEGKHPTQGKYFVAANILEAPDYSERKWVIDKNDPDFTSDFNTWKSYLAPWTDPYKIIDLNGHKVCLIGIATKQSLVAGNLEEIKPNWSFIDYNASAHYAKELLQEKEGTDTFNQIESFILLTHIGATEENHWLYGEAGELAQTIDTPIDAILAGHTHKNLCKTVYNNKIDRPIVITQTVDKMQSFADLKLNFDDRKPVGQRFKSIEAQIITPKINDSSYEEAKKQLDEIEKNPRNEIVKKTCEEYNRQKALAKQTLTKQISKTSSGLSYLQSDYYRQYVYPEDVQPLELDKVLVEQAGAFAAKAEIAGFNKYFDEAKLPTDEYKKANIAYISNESIKRGLSANSEITLNQMYDLFPYDEYAVTCSLTYFQLEQIIKYMFTGKNDRKGETICTDQFMMSPDSKAFMIPTLEFPFGPNQFYGFAFNVKKADKDDKQFRKYNYVADSLKIYDPDNVDCKIDDPSTWLDKSYWQNEAGEPLKIITMIINVFDYDDGNNQNLMIRQFAENNEFEAEKQYHVKRFHSLDVRDLAIRYIKTLQDHSLSNDVCKALANLIE